jgi:hypothetical protein
MQGNHEQRNQQANLPLFNIEMKTTQMTCKSLKRGRGEVKSGFPFPLFPFSNIFYLFLNFLFYQMQRRAKTNMQWKRRKENGRFGGERKNSNANGRRMGGKENEITTGLPPSESFTFIVCR